MSRISRLLKRDSGAVSFVEPKLFVPVDCQVPETPKTIMARTMLQSGLITKDDYEKMLGVTFDIRSETEETFSEAEFEDYEDDYLVSSFAEYEEEVEYEQEESSALSPESAQPEQSVEPVETTDGTEAE